MKLHSIYSIKISFSVLLFFLLLFNSMQLYSLRSQTSKPMGFSENPILDSTEVDLLSLWKELQKAETLLVQTSIKLNKDRNAKIFEGITLERPLLILLIRLSSGLNIEGFTADDYLIRYPFSTTELITREIEKLVELNYLEINVPNSTYKVADKGITLVNHWIQERGYIMDLLDIEILTQEEINKILEIDNRILNALVANISKEANPILYNRLSGLQPNYVPKKLWHHWQLIWTILAAHEDSIEHIRQAKSIGPLTWSIRRGLWFIERRPWLAATVSFQSLVDNSQAYAPLENPEIRIKEAVTALKKVGWLVEENKTYQLTEHGLLAHDKDEELIMKSFFGKWPLLSNSEINSIYASLKKLNSHLETSGTE